MQLINWCNQQESVPKAWENLDAIATSLDRTAGAIQCRMQTLAKDYDAFAKSLTAIRAKSREMLAP